MKKIPLTAKTIKKPMAQGYLPTTEEAQKLVDEMQQSIIEQYEHGELYEFKGIYVGYSKCKGYGSHKACNEVVPNWGSIVFELKEK